MSIAYDFPYRTKRTLCAVIMFDCLVVMCSTVKLLGNTPFNP